MPKAGKPESIEAHLDGDWACDDIDRTSAPAGYLMVGGCRLHIHSRTTQYNRVTCSAEELRKFLPMIGCHTMTVKKENFNAVKTMLKAMLAAKVTAFLASMAETMNL